MQVSSGTPASIDVGLPSPASTHTTGAPPQKRFCGDNLKFRSKSGCNINLGSDADGCEGHTTTAVGLIQHGEPTFAILSRQSNFGEENLGPKVLG